MLFITVFKRGIFLLRVLRCPVPCQDRDQGEVVGSHVSTRVLDVVYPEYLEKELVGVQLVAQVVISSDDEKSDDDSCSKQSICSD